MARKKAKRQKLEDLAEYTDASEMMEVLARRSKKRDRGWEEETNHLVATYRGIPPSLHEQIKEIAAKLFVPVGDVARLFLEHSLEHYQSGNLEIEPALHEGRATLFPPETGDSDAF